MATKEALKRRFDASRLVFWKDESGGAREEAEALAGELGVEFVAVENNEFGLKDRLIREEPETAFLVYRAGPLPANEENWLWDLELANQVFDADRATLVAHELGLDAHLSTIEKYQPFFGAKARVAGLAKLIQPTDSEATLKQKMVAVLLRQEGHELTDILRALLVEHAADADAGYESLVKFGLDEDLWGWVRSYTGYDSSSPSVRDFSLWLFALAQNRFQPTEEAELQSGQLGRTRTLFNALRDHIRSGEAMQVLARRAARELDFDASSVDYSSAGNFDVFIETERQVVASLAEAARLNAINRVELTEVLRDREDSPWVSEFEREYDAIEAAVDLFAATAEKPWAATFDEGLDRYRSQWFLVDQHYRHYVHAARQTGDFLDDLSAQVEIRYLEFLQDLGNTWQDQVDEVSRWQSSVLRSQNHFYNNYIRPHVGKGKRKAVVIISDALRYEIAEELATRIQRHDRFQASLDANLGALPSITPRGMAALLPHKEVSLTEDGKKARVDGLPSNEVVERAKILEGVGGTALSASDVANMNRDEMRNIYRDHEVIYVYHNRIDKAGEEDPKGSDVFDAAEKAMDEIEGLIRSWTNANATNIWITADHGFIFRNSPLQDPDYLNDEPSGDRAKKFPRFAFGHGLVESASHKKLTADQMGLTVDFEAVFPRSVFLHEKSRAGRYAHGGTSLQEVVVPVIHVRKGRSDDTETVNVRLITGSDRITTGRLVVEFHQEDYIGGKILPTTLRAGLYVGDQLISDRKQISFDTEEGAGAELHRELPLLLTPDADEHNNKTATLKVEEQVAGTSQWKPYRDIEYRLQRGFMRDF